MSRVLDNPISRKVACPACFAQPGEACTAPTNTGRREVKWFHYARTKVALEAQNLPSETSDEA